MMAQSKQECLNAGRDKHLRVHKQKGQELREFYLRCGKDLGFRSALLGAQHAKAFYAHPLLVLGSANWSTEASRELSRALRISGDVAD